MEKGEYEIRSVRTFMGHEGHGFNAVLLRKGRKIADVHDMADGGCYSYYFKDEKERELFFGHARKQAAVNSIEPWDTLVAEMVDAHLADRKLRKMCRNRTVFRLQGDEEGRYRTLDAGYSAEVAGTLRRRHAGRGLEIINERYMQEGNIPKGSVTHE